MSQVNDVYQAGRLAYQTNLGGTVLATFTYDPSGIPESVVVGADPVNGPRYYYVYNGHGDVVALTDASGNVVASYSYDVWGNLTSSSETIPNANGWTNPYRYDGRDGARYDTETGLYWLSTRAYDPTLGRFLQRDPLGRMPLFFWSQPYAYAGNNPLVNVDPTGERYTDALVGPETAKQQIAQARRTQQVARVMPRQPAPPKGGSGSGCGGCKARGAGGSGCKEEVGAPTCAQIANARKAADDYAGAMAWLFGILTGATFLSKLRGAAAALKWLGGLASKLPWLSGFMERLMGAAEDAVVGVFATIIAETAALGALFWAQAHLWSDDMWRSKIWFGIQSALATGIVIAGNVEMGIETASLVDLLGGGPEDPVGDVLAVIAGLAALAGNALYFGIGVGQTLENEREDLWG